MTIAAVFAAALTALGVAGPASAANPIVNGSFQTGDLTGWSSDTAPGALVSVVSGGVDADGYTADIATGNSGPGEYSSLWQTFYAPRGYRVTGFARNFGDCDPPNYDDGEVFIDGNLVYDAPYACFSDWTQFTYTLTYTGYHTIYAQHENTLDDEVSSHLQLDNVRYLGLYRV